MRMMINILLLSSMIIGLLVGCSQPDKDKKAVLVVSFGTSYADTRAKTIEATENLFEEEFSSYDVYRAFTSQTIINILESRDNIQVYNVEEALKMLKKEGYGSVVVQSLHVMNGQEYDDMTKTIDTYSDDFHDLVIGKALLSSEEDYIEVAEAMASQFENTSSDAVVFLGHGTHHEANAVYPALEYVFHDLGYTHAFIGTIEGFPSFESVLKKLKKNDVNKVTLMPLLLVAGDHAQKDMAGDGEKSWKTMLKAEGFEVEIYMHGMGENPVIRNLFVRHAEAAIEGAQVD